MNFFTEEELAQFEEFNSSQIQIVRDGTATKGARGEPILGAPIVVLPLQSCQVWDLSESDKAGLSGEEIAQTRKIRLNAYHPELSEKMTAYLDGKAGNIVLCGDDGSKSVSILILRLTKQ